MFKLHDRLAADTVLVHPLTLCQLLCMNNRVWPWLILVPARPDVTELHHLPPGLQRRVIAALVGLDLTRQREGQGGPVAGGGLGLGCGEDMGLRLDVRGVERDEDGGGHGESFLSLGAERTTDGGRPAS